MTQTSKIFGVLLFAFVIYVTLKGQLPKYFGLFSRNANAANDAAATVAMDTDNGPSIKSMDAMLNRLIDKVKIKAK